MKMTNSPSTTQRMIVEQRSKESIALSTPSFLSLARKAGKCDIPLTVLEQVYARGLLASKYHPKNTPEQQAFHRVDSFIHEGRAFEMDKDLITEVPAVPDGKKHMDVIKAAIKNHQDRNKPLEEAQDWGYALGSAVRRAVFGSGKKKVVKSGISRISPEAKKIGISQEKIKKEKYQARQIHAAGGKIKTRPAMIAARLTRAKSSQAIRARGQEQAEIRQKTPGAYMGKQERFAERKPGATYSSDPQTPEQKAAQAERNKKMQAQHTGQGTWKPSYAVGTQTQPKTGVTKPKSRMTAQEFQSFTKANPNVKIRGMKR